jgi:hypothetical protein
MQWHLDRATCSVCIVWCGLFYAVVSSVLQNKSVENGLWVIVSVTYGWLWLWLWLMAVVPSLLLFAEAADVDCLCSVHVPSFVFRNLYGTKQTALPTEHPLQFLTAIQWRHLPSVSLPTIAQLSFTRAFVCSCIRAGFVIGSARLGLRVNRLDWIELRLWWWLSWWWWQQNRHGRTHTRQFRISRRYLKWTRPCWDAARKHSNIKPDDCVAVIMTAIKCVTVIMTAIKCVTVMTAIKCVVSLWQPSNVSVSWQPSNVSLSLWQPSNVSLSLWQPSNVSLSLWQPSYV